MNIKKKVLLIAIPMLMFASCTYSITMVHTEGQATDVVDETATNAPTTSVRVPITPSLARSSL